MCVRACVLCITTFFTTRAAGTAVVTFSASTLGLYRVHIFGGRARDLLPDCPVALTVVPGVVDVEKVTVSVLPPSVCAADRLAAGKRDRHAPASKMIEVRRPPASLFCHADGISPLDVQVTADNKG
jgi:hypothetical protein